MKNVFGMLIMALGFGACSMNGFDSVDAKKFADIIENQDVQILDVRTADEYAESHISGAVNMDMMKTDFRQKILSLDKQKKVAVYCRSGKRSKSAAQMLVKAGFEVVELKDGYTSWEKLFPSRRHRHSDEETGS